MFSKEEKDRKDLIKKMAKQFEQTGRDIKMNLDKFEFSQVPEVYRAWTTVYKANEEAARILRGKA
jgi:hypothetical protein